MKQKHIYFYITFLVLLFSGINHTSIAQDTIGLSQKLPRYEYTSSTGEFVVPITIKNPHERKTKLIIYKGEIISTHNSGDQRQHLIICDIPSASEQPNKFPDFTFEDTAVDPFWIASIPKYTKPIKFNVICHCGEYGYKDPASDISSFAVSKMISTRLGICYNQEQTWDKLDDEIPGEMIVYSDVSFKMAYKEGVERYLRKEIFQDKKDINLIDSAIEFSVTDTGIVEDGNINFRLNGKSGPISLRLARIIHEEDFIGKESYKHKFVRKITFMLKY